ncbi:MAG: hypothetical protein IT269_14630 [Saprospiraceae bacterium]|nr:hypothetical protein [Saprospiraceae bacterium]
MQDNKTFVRFLLAFACLSTHFISVNAQTHPVIGHDFTQAYIQPDYWIDSSHTATFSTVLTFDSSTFQPATSPFQTFGKKEGDLWVRWSVINTLSDTVELQLFFNRKDLDSIQVWQRTGHKDWVAQGIMGDQIHSETSSMLSGYACLVKMTPGENHFYACVKNRFATKYLMLELYSNDAFLERNRLNMLLFGLYLGIIFISICICTTLYYLFRKPFFLYYVLYALNMVLWELYNFSLDGHLISLLGRYCISLFVGITFGLFFLSYVKIKKLSLATWRLMILVISIWTFFIIAIVTLHYLNQEEYVSFLLTLTNIVLFLNVLIINAFLIIYMRSSIEARILFIAELPIGLAYTILLMRNLGMVDNFPYFQFLIPIGFVTEVVFFSLAFATFFRHMEIQRKLLAAQLLAEEQRHKFAVSYASVSTKDRIAQEINESIVAELAGIEALNKSVMAQARTGLPKAVPLLEQISRMSRHVNESVSDLIWVIRSNNDPLNDLAERIKQHSSRLLGAKNIQLELNIPQHLPLMQMSMEARQNIYLIFKENLNNALKYSNCTKISIRMTVVENVFEYEFYDNGVGFNTEKTTNGMGLDNIRKRATDIGADLELSSDQSGTHIALTLNMAQTQRNTPTE